MAFPIKLVSSTSAGKAVTTGDSGFNSGSDFFDDATYINSSADGRFIVFESNATNLVDGDTNGRKDIFLKDMNTGAIKLVSTGDTNAQGLADSLGAEVSDDGRYVMFQSASQFGETLTGFSNIFRKDMVTGALNLVSTSFNSASQGSMSPDGRYIVFTVNETVNSKTVAEVYRRDMQTNTTTLVSTDVTGESKGDGDSQFASISDDGNRIVFESKATNLGAGDGTASSEIFIKYMDTGVVERVSETKSHTLSTAGTSTNASISGNGHYVVFESDATGLVDTSVSLIGAIYYKNLDTGDIQLVATNPKAKITGNWVHNASISNDGRFVTFTNANAISSLTDKPASLHEHYVKDMATGDIKGLDITILDAFGFLISQNPLFNSLPASVKNFMIAQFNKAQQVIPSDEPSAITISGDGKYAIITTQQALTGKSMPKSAPNDNQYDVFRIDLSEVSSKSIKPETIKGSDGDDVDLTGGFGKDILAGGAGDDSYLVDLVKSGIGAKAAAILKYVVNELNNNGIDTLKLSGANFDLLKATLLSLPKFVENLDISATGQALLNLKGALDANILTGNAGQNVIDGDKGDDTLVGGAGDDTLIGGAGADSLEGGLDNDTYIVNVSENSEGLMVEDAVTENADEGQDTLKIVGVIKSAQTLDVANFSNIENLDISLTKKAAITLQGDAAANKLIGNAANNVINGGDGDNTLDGGAGNDSMTGGVGNDTYYVDSKDVITDAGGIDTVVSLQKAYTLGVDMENLILFGKVAQQGTGNDLDNQLTGNEKGNLLTGGAGNDVIDGGLGGDKLTGGDGNDVFVFSTNLKGNLDHITDFASGDHIELDHRIFMQLGSGALSADNFVVGSKALDANDYIIYQNGTLSYDADGNGKAAAIKFATLDKVDGTTFELHASDIIVV